MSNRTKGSCDLFSHIVQKTLVPIDKKQPGKFSRLLNTLI